MRNEKMIEWSMRSRSWGHGSIQKKNMHTDIELYNAVLSANMQWNVECS